MERVARPLADRFWSKVASPNERGCRLWLGAKKSGPFPYGLVRPERSKPMIRAHRVAWTLAHGPIPFGLVVCHRCDVPLCVEIEHLFLGTVADNNADMRAKRRDSRGESHRDATEARRPRREAAGRAKLQEHQVTQIRAALTHGVMHKDIAVVHGVSLTTVGRIRRGVGRGSWPLVV